MGTGQNYGLSSSHYVRARIRPEASNGDNNWTQLKIASDQNCDHLHTICTLDECVESWALDWELHLHRTAGGRRIADALRYDYRLHRPYPSPEGDWPPKVEA